MLFSHYAAASLNNTDGTCIPEPDNIKRKLYVVCNNQFAMDYASINSVRLHKKRCVKGSVPYVVGNVLDANVHVVENVSGKTIPTKARYI